MLSKQVAYPPALGAPSQILDIPKLALEESIFCKSIQCHLLSASWGNPLHVSVAGGTFPLISSLNGNTELLIFMQAGLFCDFGPSLSRADVSVASAAVTGSPSQSVRSLLC